MTKRPTNGSQPLPVQDVCIDLPGETVRCWRSSDKIRVVLRKHRDVFFEVNLRPGAVYTVESTGDFYSPREKRLMRKAKFLDGERFHVWVGREFKHALVLKLDGRVLGTYPVNRFDPTRYGNDPKTKPEPLVVLIGKEPVPAPKSTGEYAWDAGNSPLVVFKSRFDPKLALLREFGSDFGYAVPPEKPEIQEYAAVTLASPEEVLPHVRQELDRGKGVEGTADQLLAMPGPASPVSALQVGISAAVRYVASNQVFNHNAFKEGAGYFIENFKAMNTLGMRIRIEPKVKGKYRVIIKGVPLSRLASQFVGAGVHAKIKHINAPLGSKATSFLDGNFGRTGKNGFGGTKRITLTTASNFRAGMKVQAIGTVIDIIGDANTVYSDEQGSRDLSEFLGRAGVSILKAGTTAAIGSALAPFLVFGASWVALAAGFALPVIVAVGVVVAGYFAAATLVDLIDDGFDLKERVARAAR